MKYHIILVKNAVQRVQQLCDCFFRNRIKEYGVGTCNDVCDNKIKCVIGIKEHSVCTSLSVSEHSHS